ncbi:MAG TPA: hypothetical protein VMZ52_20455 [Bryobacteraceae bacterium]|nr:hypothetical protein [Bryobacteraceae bacterium]
MQKRFRYVHEQRGCFDNRTDPVPGAAGEHRNWPSLDCRAGFYKAGFIEYNEDGSPVDPDQEKKVLALIDYEKQRADGHKIITVAYVHGWKNNASQVLPGRNPQDVERFETALSELGYRARTADNKPGIPVIGVYIGWRGKSVRGPGWFTWLSYWPRRNVANHVGGPDVATTLNRIIDQTNKDSNTSRVLLVGHSFGARVLEHAIETHKVKLYDSVRGQPAASPRVDLVLYVNSANDSRLSLGRVQALKSDAIVARHPDYDPIKCAQAGNDRVCRDYPLLVAISSRADWATRGLLPVANSMYPDRGSAPPPVIPAGEFLDKTPAAPLYIRTAAAQMRFLHSHDVVEAPCPRRSAPACSSTSPNCVFAFSTVGEETVCYAVSKRQPEAGKKPFNDSAFWIMAVDKPVIPDHGGIWNLSFVDMLGELMAPRGFFEPGTGRVRLQAATSAPGS